MGTPSPKGTQWDIGGTCVNVGCIPKKLMHIASLYRETQGDETALGWKTKSTHSWGSMVTSIDDYIKSLNFGYKSELRSKKVKYYNKFATFQDKHTVKLGDDETATAEYFIIACGGRPNYGDYPGAKECCISSDDIFWQKTPPGKTLVVGASYIALECAGFLTGFGFDTTVMVRSILLRGFDQGMANLIGEYMERHGTKFVNKTTPSKFEKTADGKVRVFVGDEEFGVYDTVLMAIGRTGCANQLNLGAAGLAAQEGKLVCNEFEQTSVEHIYAIGDVVLGKPELTPVAIQTGKVLVKRLFDGSTKKMDYTNIATTIFTPIEFGTCGYSEDEAKKTFGEERIKIYHASAVPLEWKLFSERTNDLGYCKLVCDTEENEKVLGVHVLGPHSGEVMQGFAIAVKAGVTKELFDDTVGIHPTFAETFTTMTDVKDGEAMPDAAGC